jgi:hypothetical protein
MVVMVGIDVHKDTHCAVAVDEVGKQLGRPITVRAATRTQIQNQLRWHLHELDPAIDPAKRGLDRPCELGRVQTALETMPAGTVRRIALELVADIRRHPNPTRRPWSRLLSATPNRWRHHYGSPSRSQTTSRTGRVQPPASRQNGRRGLPAAGSLT